MVLTVVLEGVAGVEAGLRAVQQKLADVHYQVVRGGDDAGLLAARRLHDDVDLQ